MSARNQTARRARIASMILAFMVAVASESHATVAYNNLAVAGGLTSADFSFAGRSRIAQQFTAAGTGLITSVKLNLYRDQSFYGTSQYYNVEIWSGSGTTPTSSLAVLTTNGDWSTTAIVSGTHASPVSVVEFTTLSGTTTLTAGTKYWIVVTQAVNGPASKRWIVAGSGNQTASYNANTSTWTNNGTGSNLGAQVTVGAVPGTGLAAIGMVGVAAMAGRRRRR